MTPRIVLLTVLTVFLTTACSFVDKTSGGEKVRVLAIDEVKSCRKLGTTSTSVLDNLAGIPRPQETIEEELRTVASNSASKMGGDTIVPATTAVEGQQTFHVYKCVDPNAA